MSDPDAVREPTPPPQPPRPSATRVGSTPQSQLEADEQYARQLAEHYGGGSGRGGAYGQPSSGQRGQQRQTGPHPDDPYGENHSFIDDDLPIIKENLKKGFQETRTAITGWMQTIQKKIEGDDAESPKQGYSSGQYRGRQSGDGRQSNDYNRYDADPQVLGDDFAGMQLNSDGSMLGVFQRKTSLIRYRYSTLHPTSCQSRPLQAYSIHPQVWF